MLMWRQRVCICESGKRHHELIVSIRSKNNDSTQSGGESALDGPRRRLLPASNKLIDDQGVKHLIIIGRSRQDH